MAERIHCKVTLGSTSERFSVPYTPPSPIASLVSASLEAFNLQHAPSIKFGLIDQDGDKLQLHTQEDLDAVWPPTPGSQLRLFISLPGLSRSRDSSQCEPSSAPSPASTQGTVGQEAIDRPQGQGAAHHPPDAGPDPLNRIQQQHPSTASNTSSLHPSEAEAQKVRHGCDSSPSQAQLLHTLKSLVQVLDHSHKQSAAAARTVHATPTANAPLNTPDPALSSQTHTSWRPPPPPRTSPTHPHHHHPPWPPHCGPPPHHGHGHGPSPSPPPHHHGHHGHHSHGGHGPPPPPPPPPLHPHHWGWPVPPPPPPHMFGFPPPHHHWHHLPPHMRPGGGPPPPHFGPPPHWQWHQGKAQHGPKWACISDEASESTTSDSESEAPLTGNPNPPAEPSTTSTSTDGPPASKKPRTKPKSNLSPPSSNSNLPKTRKQRQRRRLAAPWYPPPPHFLAPPPPPPPPPPPTHLHPQWGWAHMMPPAHMMSPGTDESSEPRSHPRRSSAATASGSDHSAIDQRKRKARMSPEAYFEASSPQHPAQEHQDGPHHDDAGEGPGPQVLVTQPTGASQD